MSQTLQIIRNKIVLLFLLSLISSFKIDKIKNENYGINSYSFYIRNVVNYNEVDSIKIDSKFYLSLNNFEELPGKYNNNQLLNLINLLDDTTADFAANIVLYHLTQENVNYYYIKFNSINEWRDKFKKHEIKEWKRRYYEIYSR